MKQTLNKKPDTYSFRDLKVKFADGRPLSCDELHFLQNHETTLSHLGELMRYYMKPYHQKADHEHSFLLHSDILDKPAIQQLKKRLHLFLENKKSIQLPLSTKQFEKLREMTSKELILFHGNQYLTGAPFFPGGIAPVIFFQWGNAFGVAKYMVMAEERALNSNVLIHFENMLERDLDECVQEYIHEHKLELAAAPSVSPVQEKIAEPVMHHSPTLTLSIHHPDEKDKK